MTATIELRLPVGCGERLQATIYSGGRHEHVAFGLVGHARLGANDVLLVRDVIPLAENEYQEVPGHGASWSGTTTRRIAERAQAEGLGVLIFHAHDHHGPTCLSRDDQESAERLLPFFQRRVPGRPHASIVLSKDHAAGVIMTPNSQRPAAVDVRVRWYGQAITDWPTRHPGPRRRAERYQRQEVVVGQQGQEALFRATVAVVGLGGGGSHVVQQLAHLGIGHLVLVDDDRASMDNQHRLIGMTRLDGILRRRKTSIQRRQAQRINPDTTVTIVNKRLPEAEAVAAVLTADVIIGCLDNLDARVDLQHLAIRYLIPYIDIGLKIRPRTATNPTEALVVIAGNVFTYRPGAPCMWCTGFLSQEKLAEDRGHPDRAYATTSVGRPAEAQVVSMNGVLASQAVNEALQLLAGFAGTGITIPSITKPHDEGGALVGYRKLDGITGTLDEWGLQPQPNCQHCNDDLARGQLVWRP